MLTVGGRRLLALEWAVNWVQATARSTSLERKFRLDIGGGMNLNHLGSRTIFSGVQWPELASQIQEENQIRATHCIAKTCANTLAAHRTLCTLPSRLLSISVYVYRLLTTRWPLDLALECELAVRSFHKEAIDHRYTLLLSMVAPYKNHGHSPPGQLPRTHAPIWQVPPDKLPHPLYVWYA